MKKRMVVLSGAGISAESGLPTFRDGDGLWEGHSIEEVATPEAWSRNPQLVLEFYNQRRQHLNSVDPNEAHRALANAERDYEVTIITQNVDDLHERAGSSNVLHLHGELLKSRSTSHPPLVYPCSDDIKLGDLCPAGSQLRPHIVWFGEAVPMLDSAMHHVIQADYLIIVGTSLLVYPAASLLHFASEQCSVYYIDPKPSSAIVPTENIVIIPEKATSGLPQALERLAKDP